jgi:hypothetical protein
MALVLIAVANVASTYLWYRDAQPKEESFSDKANEMATRGDFADLEKMSRARLEKYPMDLNAKWYLGVSQYELGRYQEAKDTLFELNAHAPQWEKGITQMIVRVEAKLKANRKK